MTRLPVVLLSDFGWDDPYVGQVKGVLQRLSPGVPMIDLCHELPPFAVRAGSWLIERTWHHFPKRAVWLCVVDPGVGGARRALAGRVGGVRFVGPDNGLLSPFLSQPGVRVVEIAQAGAPGRTFHGRDLFAPVAACLAGGEKVHRLGKRVGNPVLERERGWVRQGSGWQAEVVWIDRYGNLITGLPVDRLQGRTVVGNPGGRQVGTFQDLPVGESGLLVGSFGTVEVVVNQGSAAKRFGVAVGDWVTVLPGDGGG